jgi:hypothetical protein
MSALELGTGLPAYILFLVMNNGWDQPQIAGVNLLLEYDVEPRIGRVQHASLDRYRVAPGETVEVSAVLGVRRGGDRVVRRELLVPPETPAGRLEVTVGGALAASRSAAADDMLLPRDLGELVRLINRLRRNDRVYVLATREEPGWVLQGSRLPNLPASAATVLSYSRRGGFAGRTLEQVVIEEAIATDSVIEGSVRLQLEVLSP